METMAERLKKLRLKYHLSQNDVAKKVHITASAISSYERGEKQPSLAILVALADVLHSSTDYILGRTTLQDSHIYVDVTNLSETQIKAINMLIDSITNLDE